MFGYQVYLAERIKERRGMTAKRVHRQWAWTLEAEKAAIEIEKRRLHRWTGESFGSLVCHKCGRKGVSYHCNKCHMEATNVLGRDPAWRTYLRQHDAYLHSLSEPQVLGYGRSQKWQ